MNAFLPALACLLLLTAVVSGGPVEDAVTNPEYDESRERVRADNLSEGGTLLDVKSWLCVYDGVDAGDVIDADFDLVDVDPDGFSRTDVTVMKESEKIVIAYISIGEAEEYRYYWDPDASYLLEENPDWAGNWYVDFSSPAWQSLIINDYIPRIKAKGFDGLYMDTLETYYLEDRYPSCSRENMTAFVRNISAVHRSRSLYIIVQNGLGIAPDIAACIDGVGVEETYCRAVYVDVLGRHVNGVPQRPAVTKDNEATMDWLRNKDKLVLTLDYAVLRFQAARCYERSRQRGYVPYVSTAALDEIVPPPVRARR